MNKRYAVGFLVCGVSNNVFLFGLGGVVSYKYLLFSFFALLVLPHTLVHMALIWLKYPIQWHSSRAPAYKQNLTPEENRLITSKWLFWYEADWDYGQTTLIFFCVAIACVLALNVIFLLRNRSAPIAKQHASIIDRVTAALRYTVARQYHIPLFHWYSPPLAAIIGVAGIFIFILALSLGAHPYQWPNMAMGHSPPIATRTGWISIAVMPFMIAFATKVNWIGMLTGTSHEKLQVFHRWSALVMYITSLIHTFIFIVQAVDLDEWEVQWKTNWFWTGIAALVPQTFLVFMSWGYFRNKYYETFKRLHFLAASLFMVFLFIHCCFRLTSWDYFAATAGIYFAAWFARYLRTIYNTGFGVPATLELLSDGQLLKLTVQTPPRVKWSPGQHVFVRFLNVGIHVFSSHPFTVTSLPSDGYMEFIFGVQGGITKKLDNMVKGKTSVKMRVFIDGPYGGLPASLIRGFDHVYLLAGGTGMTFTLPVLTYLVKESEKGNLKSINYLAAVKKRGAASWLQDKLTTMDMNTLRKTIHVTDPEDQSGLPKLGKDGGSEDSSLTEQKAGQADSKATLFAGRPNLPSVIRDIHNTRSGRVAIVACGPESFLYDVRNTVAECQLVLLDGCSECTDLFLHTENYSW